MRQRSVFLLGGLVSAGLMGFASGAIAQPSAPVVRANGFTKQVPSCYIETTGNGFQNLDAACLMGKVPDSGTVDMVTDRDKDGIPDELQVYFKQMDAMGSISSEQDPAVQRAKAEQSAKLFQQFAQRAPVAPQMKAGLKEVASIFGEMSRISPSGPGKDLSPEAMQRVQQLSTRMQRMEKTMSNLSRDPFMQKVAEYANVYGQRQRQSRRQPQLPNSRGR
jgi:hypothetical protein